MTADDETARAGARAEARGEPYALVTVVRAIAPTSAYVGAQAIVLADGTMHGWIGGGCAKDVVIGAAQAAIESGEPRLVRITQRRASRPTPASSSTRWRARAMARSSSSSSPTARAARYACWATRPPPTRPASSPTASDPPGRDAGRSAGRAGRDPGPGRRRGARGGAAQPRRHVLMIASRRKAEKLREVDARARRRRTQLARLRRRRVPMPAPRLRAKSRWWRSSACSRRCAARVAGPLAGRQRKPGRRAARHRASS